MTPDLKARLVKITGPLTPARLKVLDAFYRLRGECYPTIAEIASECNISRTTAIEHIERLVRDGYLIKLECHIRKYAIKEQE